MSVKDYDRTNEIYRTESLCNYNADNKHSQSGKEKNGGYNRDGYASRDATKYILHSSPSIESGGGAGKRRRRNWRAIHFLFLSCSIGLPRSKRNEDQPVPCLERRNSWVGYLWAMPCLATDVISTGAHPGYFSCLHNINMESMDIIVSNSNTVAGRTEKKVDPGTKCRLEENKSIVQT